MVPETSSPSGTLTGVEDLEGPGLFDFLKIYVLDGQRDPLKILAALREDFGDTVRVKFPDFGGEVLLLSNPEMMEEVLLKQQKHFQKPDTAVSEDVEAIMGAGLLTTDGETWRRQHRVLMPHFQENAVESMVPLAQEEAERLLQRWRSGSAGQRFDLFREMKRVGLRFISRALYGYELSEEEVRNIRESIDTLRAIYRSRRTSLVTFPLWLPTPQNRRAEAARRHLYEFADTLIDRCRDGKLTGETMLSTMVEACYGEGEQKLTPEEVRAEIVTFIIAGYTTTAAAMGWMAYELLHHPEDTDRIVEECKTAWSDDTPEAALQTIPYTRAAFDETLRKYPTAPWIARSPKETITIDGLRIPGGTPIIMTPFLMHRNPDYFENPMEFRPERFLGDDSPESLTYIPFSVGAHQCIGREIALMEGPAIMSRIYAEGTFERRMDTPDSTDIQTAVNIEPEDDIPVGFSFHT